MAKRTSTKFTSKTPRKNAAQSKKRAATGASRTSASKKQAAAASDEKTGSRLAGLFKSPIVRNIFAAGLVSAAGALLYKKREDDSDSSQRTVRDNEGVEVEDSTPEPAARKRRGPSPAGVKRSMSTPGEPEKQLTSDVEGAGAGAAPRRRGRPKKSDAGATPAASRRGARLTKAGATGTPRKAAAGAASSPAGIETPVAGLRDTETSAFAISAPAQGEAPAVEVPATAPADDQR